MSNRRAGQTEEEYLERCSKVWKKIETEGLKGEWIPAVKVVSFGSCIRQSAGTIGRGRKNVQAEQKNNNNKCRKR